MEKDVFWSCRQNGVEWLLLMFAFLTWQHIWNTYPAVCKCSSRKDLVEDAGAEFNSLMLERGPHWMQNGIQTAKAKMWDSWLPRHKASSYTNIIRMTLTWTLKSPLWKVNSSKSFIFEFHVNSLGCGILHNCRMLHTQVDRADRLRRLISGTVKAEKCAR